MNLGGILAKKAFFGDNKEMSQGKLVAGLGLADEMWGAALKESGFRYVEVKTGEEAVESRPDFVLLDLHEPSNRKDLEKIRGAIGSPIISLIEDGVGRNDLIELRRIGASDYVSRKTPPEEVVLRLQSMAASDPDKRSGEARSAQRIWFQQRVEFKIFDKNYEAWSTTLSETGIFLRTGLSFPLYSVMHLKFHIWGDDQPFETDGVIVRQEVDQDPKGLGVMFQNLKGDSIRRLESFFELYK